LHFKVYNKSGVPGMVSLVRSNNFKNEFFKNIVLPPRGAWTVCVPTDTLFKPTKSMLLQYMFSNGFQISTGYSLNLPASVLLHAGTIPAELPSGIAMGIYSCDSSAFLLPTGTILVDNEDAGFFVEEDLPFFQQLKKRENYFPSGKVLSRWTAQVKHDAFGESVKSFHTKTNSRKSSKIEWNAEIAQEGKYELWIYYNNPNPSTKDTKDPYPPQRYALHHDGVVDEIELFPHIFSGKLKLRYANGYQEEQNYKVGNSKWISVGQYDMKVGSVKLILHDDGVEEGKWLYADAVKWVRVD